MTDNKRLRCAQPLNDEFSEGIVTGSRLKFNVLCQFTNKPMLDDTATKSHPSTRKADNTSAPSAINSPSPPPSQEITSDNDEDDDSLPD